MIRKLDKLWFRLLGVLYRWALRRGQAHCRREKMRRFRRHLGADAALPPRRLLHDDDQRVVGRQFHRHGLRA